jgi:hypothetical protein
MSGNGLEVLLSEGIKNRLRKENIMTRNKMKLVLLVSILLMGLTGTLGWASNSLQGKIDERTTVIWIEGTALGDMVIGSRAQAAFVYVDGTLSHAVASDPNAPEWLKWHSNHYSDKKLKNRALFIMRYKAIKRWSFSPEMIRIGEYKVTDDDILTSKDFMAVGELPPDSTGTLAFSVPAKYVPKGRNILISLGDFSGELNVPKR